MQDHPCSIVIKPTKGDFLDDYKSKSNLHIALTTSKGFVVEFDSKGVHRDRTLDWNRCIVIDNFGSPNICRDPDWGEYWDHCLGETLKSPHWTVEDYDEDGHNCFAFVLSFLRTLKQNPFSTAAANKFEFCERYILPKTTSAAKYICVYRKIKENGGVLIRDKNKISSASED